MYPTMIENRTLDDRTLEDESNVIHDEMASVSTVLGDKTLDESKRRVRGAVIRMRGFLLRVMGRLLVRMIV